MPAPRPTTTPAWSTDANYPAGGESFSGTPTKVAPSGGQQAAGFEPKAKPPAQFFNYLLNSLCAWALWLADHSGSDDEWSYPTPKTENRPVSLWLAQEITANDWNKVSGASEWDAMQDAVHLTYPLQVRIGETLSGVVAKIAPQSARATGSNRMRFRLYKVTQNFGNGSPPSSDAQAIASPDTGTTDRWDNGSSGTQTVTLTLSTPIVATADMTFFLDITSGNDSGTAGKHDRVHGCYAVLVKPGPR